MPDVRRDGSSNKIQNVELYILLSLPPAKKSEQVQKVEPYLSFFVLATAMAAAAGAPSAAALKTVARQVAPMVARRPLNIVPCMANARQTVQKVKNSKSLQNNFESSTASIVYIGEIIRGPRNLCSNLGLFKKRVRIAKQCGLIVSKLIKNYQNEQ